MATVYPAIEAMAARKIAFVTGRGGISICLSSDSRGAGGNNGIGYETVKALLLSPKRYHILMGSRSADRAKSAIERLQKECAGSRNTVEAIQIDLTCDDSIQEAFNKISASPGHVDALINNAGMVTHHELCSRRC
jgi:NAD(P)-dependent dehydrogenase (short-subunit alcohol dehydrogenase family)